MVEGARLGHAREVAGLAEEQRREFHRLFTAQEERWLDQGHGTCVLRREELSRDTESGLRFFDGRRYALDAFVIMPNHVHVLILPHEGWTLARITSTWKKNSARENNARLGQEGSL